MRLLAVLLLGLSVSMDTLFAGVAYGIRGSRVPGRSLLIIGVVTTLGIAGVMGGGPVFGRQGKTQIVVVLGVFLLIGLELMSLLQTYRTTETPRHPSTVDAGTARQFTWSVKPTLVYRVCIVLPRALQRSQGYAPSGGISTVYSTVL